MLGCVIYAFSKVTTPTKGRDLQTENIDRTSSSNPSSTISVAGVIKLIRRALALADPIYRRELPCRRFSSFLELEQDTRNARKRTTERRMAAVGKNGGSIFEQNVGVDCDEGDTRVSVTGYHPAPLASPLLSGFQALRTLPTVL